MTKRRTKRDDLIREIARSNPWYPDPDWGGVCRYCEEMRENEHEKDCLWTWAVRQRASLKARKKGLASE